MIELRVRIAGLRLDQPNGGGAGAVIVPSGWKPAYCWELAGNGFAKLSG